MFYIEAEKVLSGLYIKNRPMYLGIVGMLANKEVNTPLW